MRRNYLRAMSIAMVMVLGSTTAFACTATPKANLSTPEVKQEERGQERKETEPKNKETSQIGEACFNQVCEQDKKDCDKQACDKDKKDCDKAACDKNKKESNKQASQAFVIDNFKMIAEALEELGVEGQELDKMIKEGKNLPEVLEAKNIEVKRFKKTLLKEYYDAIEEGVEEKKITKEEGKMLKAAIKQKVMSWLEQ